MSCSICKNSVSFFNSKNCNSKHKIHKKCIETNTYFELTCQDCIFLVLENKEKPEEGCILCKEMLISWSDCKIYRNLCDNCCAKSINQAHLKKCKICKQKIQQQLSQCTKCQAYIKKPDLYTISRCEVHNYCIPCINRGQSDFSSCQNCQFYFNFIPKQHDERKVECNLCGKFPEGNSLRCSKGHTYCNICLRYLNLDLIKVFDRINCCEFCIQMLKVKYDQSLNPKPEEKNIESQPISIIQSSLEIQPSNNKELSSSETIADNLSPVSPKKHFKPEEMINQNILSINYLYLQDRNCDTCGVNVGKTYCCGHCHCRICIGNKFVEQVYYVLALIHQRLFEAIQPQFTFTCITAGCNYEIPVASMQMISLIVKEMQPEHFQIYERICAYFDGVSMRITSCSCNNIIIVQNGRKIFCTCNQ